MNQKNTTIIILVIVLAALLGRVTAQFDPKTVEEVSGVAVQRVVEQAPFTTATLSTTLASTTAVAVTELTGLDYIEIRGSATASQEIWVGVDTTPTVGYGIMVTKDCPFKMYLDTGYTIKTIASGAWSMSILQGAY